MDGTKVTVKVNAFPEDILSDLLDSGYALAEGCTREDALREITGRIQAIAQNFIDLEAEEVADHCDNLVALKGATKADGLKTVTEFAEDDA